MAKTDRYKDRGTMLVDDEPALLRPAASQRSRVEKEFLPDSFERFPAKREGEVGNEARIRRRVPVKKGRLPAWAKTRWGKIAFLLIVLAAFGLVAWAVLATRSFLLHDPRFSIETSDSIQTTGNTELTRDDLLSVFGADIGRNIFYVPLAERRAELEQIPWVERATVMRILPNQLRVAVKERKPVAFVRIGNGIKLVDAHGVILSMPPETMAARHYSFPVVTGINPGDPLSTRALRMKLYENFMTALNATGQHFTEHVSEINLSDPDDLLVTLPVNFSDLLLHFGNKDFLSRYQIFQSHVAQWEQQYPQLAAVDLRYKGEVVLKMASPPAASNANAKPTAKPAHKATAKRHTRAESRHRRRARR